MCYKNWTDLCTGKCSPSFCGKDASRTLQLTATTSQLERDTGLCDHELSWSFSESFVKDPAPLHIAEDDIVQPLTNASSPTPNPSDCGDFVGTWRSTNASSEALFTVLRQENVEAFIHIEGLYRNESSRGYFPLDGWTGPDSPSIIVMQVLFEDSLTGIGFSGKAAFLFHLFLISKGL